MYRQLGCVILLVALLIGCQKKGDYTGPRDNSKIQQGKKERLHVEKSAEERVGQLLRNLDRVLLLQPGVLSHSDVRETIEAKDGTWNKNGDRKEMKFSFPDGGILGVRFDMGGITDDLWDYTYHFEIFNESEVIESYQRLNDSLSEKYGKPLRVIEEIESPFRIGEEIDALKRGRAHMETCYKSPPKM